MKRLAALLALALLPACLPQPPREAPAPRPAIPSPAEGVWRLVSLDGRPFRGQATLMFPKPGRISGTAVCNLYSGTYSGTPPAFRANALMMTEMACPGMQQEAVFTAALSSMTRIAVAPDRLVLSNGAGRRMVFRPQP